MKSLLDKFPWLTEPPVKISYDSKTKSIYLGEFDARTATINRPYKAGRYFYYYWEKYTSLKYYSKWRTVANIIVVDSQTHEVGMVDFFYDRLREIDIQEELLREQ